MKEVAHCKNVFTIDQNIVFTFFFWNKLFKLFVVVCKNRGQFECYFYCWF